MREDGVSEEEDDEPINPLVDALFDEIEDLRLRVRFYYQKSMSVQQEAFFTALRGGDALCNS